ncbi:uncharacterized protein UDID_17109 [Ustilago sp. UG-2017a]|nr:uncharacterized protein UDID_17109 [Ustilago sp. UG-2017a]
MDAVGFAHICHEISTQLAEGRLTVVNDSTLLICSPVSTIPKPHSDKLRTIHHLSHPRLPGSQLPSVNAGIQPAFVTLQYESLQPLVELLGFSFDGVSYHKNALTFRGKSSPWLFNLYSEMVHWIASSCLPSSLPLSHYLDDFFGTVLAGEDSSHPVRMLTIACKALGLNLSPSKTFFGTTKLENLGIEVDTKALTLGITNQRRSSILHTIEALLQPGRVSLLQLQHISGLLRFVTQVAPLGCVHLGHLYAALRRAHRSPLSLLRLPNPAAAELRGLSLILPSPLHAAHIWTDACPWGLGGYLGTADHPDLVWACSIPRQHRKKNIRFLKALTVLDCLRASLPYLTGRGLTHVVFHVDNENSVAATLASPAFAKLLGCSTHAASLLLHGLSECSRHQYDSVGGEYQAFCLRHFGPNWPALPSSNLHLIKWIAELGHAGRSYHAVRHCLTALSSWHVDLGLDSSAFSHPHTQKALKGFKWLYGITQRGQKLPITLPSTWSSLDDSVLQVGSITWSETYATLRLARSKTDPFGTGVNLIVPRIGGPACPYTALHAVCGSQSLQALLFALDNGTTPFSRERAISVLRQLLGTMGLPASAYTSHSFRRRDATWAAHLGTSTEAIQAMGRWSSDCFFRYINHPPSAHRDIATSYLFSTSTP